MHDIDAQTDEELLTISLDQPMYFEVLVDRYQQAFLRKSKSILKNEQDAIDAVQDTFVKIYTKGNSFQKQEGAQFSSWAYKILINTCLTSYSKQKRAGVVGGLSDEMLSVLPDNLEAKEIKRKVDLDEIVSYLSKLPDIFRTPLKKFYLEGKSGAEIAQELGVSKNVVRTRLHRAKKEIQAKQQ